MRQSHGSSLHSILKAFSYVIVNGAVVLGDGNMTDARPGQVLLGGSGAPVKSPKSA